VAVVPAVAVLVATPPLCFSFSSFLSVFLFFLPLQVFFFFFLSFGLSPLSFFFCSVSSSLLLLFFLGPPVFIGKNRGGTWLGWPLCCRPKNCPRNTSPPSSLTRGKLRASGGGVGVFLKREMAVIEEKKIFFFFPCFARPGEEGDPQCLQNDTVLGFF
jgi:hypothetical protein